MFLKEIQESLQGSRVLDVSNGHKLCSELLNCSTVLQRSKKGNHSVAISPNPPRQNSTASAFAGSRKKIRRKKVSKVELSSISRSLYPAAIDNKGLSGYDGDIEREAIVGKVDKDSLVAQDGYLGQITFFTPLFYALELIHLEASPELTTSWYVISCVAYGM